MYNVSTLFCTVMVLVQRLWRRHWLWWFCGCDSEGKLNSASFLKHFPNSCPSRQGTSLLLSHSSSVWEPVLPGGSYSFLTSAPSLRLIHWNLLWNTWLLSENFINLTIQNTARLRKKIPNKWMCLFFCCYFLICKIIQYQGSGPWARQVPGALCQLKLT